MAREVLKALSSLSERRPCFHSEADFQFALAWEIQRPYPGASIRLEVPLRVGQKTYKLDLLYTVDGTKVAVELKYFKAPIRLRVGNEDFALTDVVAHDTNRYDYLKDILRMERLLASGAVQEAYAILLTNQPKYWTDRIPGNRVDEAFGLEHGRIVSGDLAWATHVGGTSKGRETAISLTGQYPLEWLDYSSVPTDRFNRFRTLVVTAVPGILPPEILTVQSDPAPSAESRRHIYVKLANHLSSVSFEKVALTFSEIEALIGYLPSSARKYREWWANHEGNPQAKWLSVGRAVESVDFSGETVTFVMR